MKAVANFYTDLIPKIFSSNSSVRVDTYSLPSSSSPTTNGHMDETTHWIDVSDNEIPIVGRGFSGEIFENYFNRLPLQSKTEVREKVWELSKFSTGMDVAFTTDSPSISIEYTLENDAEGLWHMCPLGTSGLDLFRYDELETNMYRFVGSTAATIPKRNETTVVSLASGLRTDNTTHKYWLFLPMRNTIMSLKIGVPSSYELPKHDSDFDRNGVILKGRKPIVWYGTSIVQGGAVSRPGSTFTNILSRELGRHVLNYGFAGNVRQFTHSLKLLLHNLRNA